MIQPKVLKGFRDSLPLSEIVKKEVIATLEENFSLYGFVPIDTPVLEYTEILLGKGGGETDKQIFHFLDNGKRDVALRFDLTVPFARFMATNLPSLPLPFKRYHIAKVWRGENPQKGRYREFYQCDFDIVGVDSAASDCEILVMMHSALRALGVDDFTIHVAHRGLFNRFLTSLGVVEHSVEILRVVDKLRKIGKEAVSEQLREITQNSEASTQILSYIETDTTKGAFATLEALEKLVGECDELKRLSEIFTLLHHLTIDNSFLLDPSITRGLDYYTGVVFETFLDKLPSIGSICSGGRYNELASLYTKAHLPGVGSSIGLDRLLSALEELKSPLFEEVATGDVIIFNQEEKDLALYLMWAQHLRKEKIRCTLYAEVKKREAQFKYAEQLNIRYALFIDEKGCIVRDLKTRQNSEILTLEESVTSLKRVL